VTHTSIEESKVMSMKSTLPRLVRRLGAPLLAAVATTVVLVSLPARLAHADDEAQGAEPCDPASDGVCDADAGSLQLDDGVIHLDGATNDAAADKAAQSGCSSSGNANVSAWWIPLPFAAVVTLASRRRRRRPRRR
jgi:MYXO-CTERM domain-containing protein